jgi:DnaK suppressor protein
VPNPPLSPEQLAGFRCLLVDQLTALYRGVHGDVRESMAFPEELDGTAPDEPRDEVDESQRVQSRDLRMSLAEGEAQRAQAIEAALRRITAGTYGWCVECGRPIELERLKLVPWTERCLDDQEELERRLGVHPPTL